MPTRVIALAIALITGAVGVFPSVAWHRCLTMAERMPAEHACCPEEADAAPVAIGAPCCESVAAVAKTARATSAPADAGLTAPVFIGLLPLPPRDRAANVVASRMARATTRVQPPGDHLHDFSSILRV